MARSTGPLLKQLRLLMKGGSSSTLKSAIRAYVVPTGDPHQSEYLAECDKHREYISGFTGSAGTAVVTETKAALWTDGRYHLQAADELDDNWMLMKDGLEGVLSPEDWLSKELPPKSQVGVDPAVLSIKRFESLANALKAGGHALIPVTQDLVSQMWQGRPQRPANRLLVVDPSVAGVSWQEKVHDVRLKLDEKQASALVISALDEVAWLLNLRGSDIEYNPVFFAFAVITTDSVNLFVDDSKLTPNIKEHLSRSDSVENFSSCGPVTVLPYDSVYSYLAEFCSTCSGKVWISENSSQALLDVLPEEKVYKAPSPISLAKAIKNEAEIAGMRDACLRDSVALCQYFAWLEREVPGGHVTEISGAEKLLKFRQEQNRFLFPSFETISGAGKNGAIIHYRTTPASNQPISVAEMYLCDSGGQYSDGTTDVTRTLHFGQASSHQKECYTRVLKGHLSLWHAVFPNRWQGHNLDALARTFLWQVGLNYLHGTGHGIGAYLNVHEGPQGISFRGTGDEPLQAGMIVSNEPGYYEEGAFGIRVENDMLIKKAATKHNFNNTGFLTMESLTLVPYEPNLLSPELLTSEEVAWINDYHEQCREQLAPLLKEKEDHHTLAWLLKKTQPLG